MHIWDFCPSICVFFFKLFRLKDDGLRVSSEFASADLKSKQNEHRVYIESYLVVARLPVFSSSK